MFLEKELLAQKVDDLYERFSFMQDPIVLDRYTKEIIDLETRKALLLQKVRMEKIIDQ